MSHTLLLHRTTTLDGPASSCAACNDRGTEEDGQFSGRAGRSRRASGRRMGGSMGRSAGADGTGHGRQAVRGR